MPNRVIGLVRHLVGIEASGGRGNINAHLQLAFRLNRDRLFLRSADMSGAQINILWVLGGSRSAYEFSSPSACGMNVLLIYVTAGAVRFVCGNVSCPPTL